MPDPSLTLFLFSVLMALGWTYINGVHRRDRANREKLESSIAKFPPFTKKKLKRLLAPTAFVDRWNHATVIAGCVCIIGTPIAVAAIFAGVEWWYAPVLLVFGSLIGAYVGEALFNSWGLGCHEPEFANPAPTTDEDEPKGQFHS